MINVSQVWLQICSSFVYCAGWLHGASSGVCVHVWCIVEVCRCAWVDTM